MSTQPCSCESLRRLAKRLGALPKPGGCLLLQATGLDPPGIKVRASKGLAAVDYFLPGYHVWAHVIEALSDLGYDLNNMVWAARA